jgi:hypothetical protein
MGYNEPFSVILETTRCLLRPRTTWMRRLENHNLVRHIAAVANGFLRMCVDASVENSASPHRPFRLQSRTWFPVQGHRSRGERLVAAAVKGSVSLTNQFNLSEDISIHVSLRQAYLRCGIRVVGKFQRHADSSVCNHLPTTLWRITQWRLKRRWMGWLNIIGVPVDDNKKQRLHGEIAGQVTRVSNQLDTND